MRDARNIFAGALALLGIVSGGIGASVFVAEGFLWVADHFDRTGLGAALVLLAIASLAVSAGLREDR